MSCENLYIHCFGAGNEYDLVTGSWGNVGEGEDNAEADGRRRGAPGVMTPGGCNSSSKCLAGGVPAQGLSMNIY